MPYHSIDDPSKLRRVLEAILLIEADLDLPTLLTHIVDEALSMTHARYGALGVIGADGSSLEQFITVGLAPEDEARIGARPTGGGVLGLLISTPQPLRLDRIADHPERFGFPDGHPPMTSFLGLPIRVRDAVYGNLYLTDKMDGTAFSDDDEALVGALAVAAGIAIENANLHRRAQEVVVYEERDRFARDLHDVVIQRLFAVGLSLQSLAALPGEADIAGRLQTAIADIDDTIRQVRSSIFELGTGGRDDGVRTRVLSLLSDLTPVVGFEVACTFDGPVDTAVTPDVAEHLLATLREAVTNVGRHARASRADVSVIAHRSTCALAVTDDGVGLGDQPVRGLGLGNMERRAQRLGGTFSIASGPEGGTVVLWEVPLA